MANQAMHTVEEALEPVKDDLKTIGETLTGHYFNFKLDAVTSLRDYTLNILGNMQAFTGIQNHRRDSPSAMCATKGVMQAIEEDIDLIGTAATLDLDYFLRNKVAESLRKRIADVLHIMTEEIVVKMEPDEVVGVPPGYEWNPSIGQTSAKEITKSNGDQSKCGGEEGLVEMPNIMRRSSPSTNVDTIAGNFQENDSDMADPTPDMDVLRMFCETMAITDAATKILMAGQVAGPMMDEGAEGSVRHQSRNRDDQISTSQAFGLDQGPRPPTASSFVGSQSYLSGREKLQIAVGPARARGNRNPWKAMATSSDGLHNSIGRQSQDSSAVNGRKDTVMEENSGPEVPTKFFGKGRDGDEDVYFSDSSGSCAMDLDSEDEIVAPIQVLKETFPSQISIGHERIAGVTQSYSKETRLSASMASSLKPSKQITPPSADKVLSRTSNANLNSTVGKTKRTTPVTGMAQQRVSMAKSKAPRAVSGRNGSVWVVMIEVKLVISAYQKYLFLRMQEQFKICLPRSTRTLVGSIRKIGFAGTPEISKTLKPYQERSVYVMDFIDYEAEKGNEDAVALQGCPTKIWSLFLHWWRFLREKKEYPVSCPWQKKRLLMLARVLDADERYIKDIEQCAVRDKMYEDEEEDIMWATHQHPDWLMLYDQSKYNMLKANGKLWQKRKT
ncbi:hypothetical protein BKA61DRAFT_711116 [Leptodontidium sp. MPI-SDFR-AT-0119]|nr:hypothetical protein BKA61DRAFT_711116 [Leptodontidium sp. MPI-SDFR-AT-0119]